MEFKTEFELEDEAEIVKTVYESVKEETKMDKMEENALEEDKRHSLVDISLNGNTLCLRIGGDDLIRVRAAANTWLRLVKVAEEMTRVVKECDPHGF
jgi:tRNA threonylcarbamoyladenosine modification (KEOPS) complex  Pcc1 subunit